MNKIEFRLNDRLTVLLFFFFKITYMEKNYFLSIFFILYNICKSQNSCEYCTFIGLPEIFFNPLSRKIYFCNSVMRLIIVSIRDLYAIYVYISSIIRYSSDVFNLF